MNRMLSLVLLLPVLGAQAQGVWRCGPEGRSFSDRPCADGEPMRMAALADRRSAAEVQSAREVAARERRLADSLRQERLAREQVADAGGRRPARVHQAARGRDDLRSRREPEGQPRPPATRRALAVEGIWRATVPSTRRAKD